MNTELILRSILLGAGLAMDAFSVSLADGLSEHDMSTLRKLSVAGTFAAFQFVMPMIGWVIVSTAVEQFGALETFIPWIALLLLLYIGGKMLIEGIRERKGGDDETESVDDGAKRLSVSALVLQGIATSIDALSVGFTIESYGAVTAAASSLIIGVVTLVICLAGLDIGRIMGTKLAGKASILGGAILIFIGIEIWVKGIFL